jgi:lipopolysaccharide assembly outer membrane protein LptD (OstA)
VRFSRTLLTIAITLSAGWTLAQTPPPSPTPAPSPSPSPVAPPSAVPPPGQPPAADPVVPGGAAAPVPAPEAAPAEPAEKPCEPTKGDVCVNAELLRRSDKNHLSWEGFVDLQFGDGRIQAEQLDLYTEEKPDGTTTRRVEAAGNVVFLRGDERLSGEKLVMDLGTGKGTFENAFGYAEPGVFVEARRIERVDPHTYRIFGGKFTSCAQPTPRWNFSASSATLKVDKRITARNVVFRVKQVPAIYIPYFVYPIEQDQRSTGFLFPHFGSSNLRGFKIGGGFFWAMNRSLDQTFYFDRYSKFGYGFGHELRYMLPSPSRGTFRTYLGRRSADGAWEHDFNWTAVQLLPGRVRANLLVQETSDLTFQEQIQDNLDYALRRNRRSQVSLQRAFGPHNLQLQADSTDTFFPVGDEIIQRTQRRLPMLRVNGSPRKEKHTGLVLGYEARAENIGNGDENGIDKYARYDFNPRLSRPISLSFLQLTPEVQVRGTRYSASELPGEGLAGGPLTRKYMETSVDMRGPTFSRVFNSPGNFYSDRYKHVIGPEATWTFRNGVGEEFLFQPKFDQHDWVVDTNEVRYSLVQRFYAKRPSRSGRLEPHEFLNWRISQTYYNEEEASEFDPNYSNLLYGETALRSSFSPIRSQMRFRPGETIQGTFTVQYDMKFKYFRNIDLSTGLNYPRFGLDAGWSRANRAAVNPENRTLTVDTVRSAARFSVVPGRFAVEGRGDYNLIDKKFIQMSARARYDVQCCGFMFEWIQSDFAFLEKENQFRFSIELANIGSMGNFMGQNPSGGLSSGFMR